MRGSLDRGVLEKTVSAGTGVRRIPHGVFIRGRHFYAYLDRFGEPIGRETRVAGRTLILERRGLVLRLEGAGFAEARRLLRA